MADTLYVNPVWPDKISWVHGIAYANLDAKLLGHHFTEIVLCMAELRPLLRHDYTLDDVLGRYATRLKVGGRIVLDYCDGATFFYRRAAS
jgi:hypothetical protein